MVRRSLLALCLSFLPIAAQTYQNRFEQVKFDRANGPSTLHGSVEVEGPTGAVNLQLGLGPGIGGQGLRFSPAVRMRSTAFTWDVSSLNDPNAGLGTPPFLIDPRWGLSETIAFLTKQAFTNTDSYVSGGLGTISPGSLDVITSDSRNVNRASSVSYPDGSSSSFGGVLPQAFTSADMALKDFGRGSDQGWFVGSMPYWTSDTVSQTPQSFVQMGGHGELILGLTKAGVAPVVTFTDPALPARTWQFPSCVLVIRGDVAFEYALSGAREASHFITLPRVANLPGGKDKPWLEKGSYILVRMLNRFGDAIVFDQGVSTLGMVTQNVVPNGYDYTARWYRGGAPTGVAIEVKYTTSVALSPTQPGMASFTAQQGHQLQVTYLGATPAPSFTLQLYSPDGASEAAPTSIASAWQTSALDLSWDYARSNMLPLKVTDNISQESFSFAYTSPAQWPVLSQVTYPTGRTTNLSWTPYPYAPNANPTVWAGYHADGMRQNAKAYGVSQINDGDTLGFSRTTTHTRVVPVPSGGGFSDTRFYDAITYPDGTTKVFYYVEPTQDGSPSYQTLAHLNHQVREIREYPNSATWQADVSVATAQSSAPLITVLDRWDTRRLGNPTGDPAVLGSDIYPTRTRTWDKESALLKVQEKTAWDGAASVWGTSTTQSFLAGTGPDLRPDYQSQALGAQIPVTYANKQQEMVAQSTHQFDAVHWVGPLATQDQNTIALDATPNLVGGSSFTAPPVARTFVPGYGLLRAATVGNTGGPQVTTAFAYQGDQTTLAADMAKLSGVTLRDPNNAATPLSGQVGISTYGYDTFGQVNLIQPMGAAWSVKENRDAFGRVTSQIGADGVVTSYAWDGAGRLTSVQQGSELPTTYGYPSARVVTVTRGTQSATLDYNGFGQLILEKRVNEQAVTSYKLCSYDAMGRSTGASVWADHGADADAAQPNLLVTTTTVTPESTVCTKRNLDGDCINWRTIPASTVTHPALYAGTVTELDWRGRVVKVTDPNGVEVSTAYGSWASGSQVTRTVKNATVLDSGTGQIVTKNLVTTLQHDAAGRLVKLTDPKGQLTNYGYDAAGRIRTVTQSDTATGVSQVRTWTYDELGRVISLVQPESGTTNYSGFAVTGKPTVTTYLGTGASPTRSTTATFDPLGRLRALTSPDGLNQAWVFDDGPSDGTPSRGKLLSATANGVARILSYEATGRLSQLRRTVDGQTFDQFYTYDPSYGFLKTHTYPDGKVQSLTYDNAKGLPNGTSFNGASLASFGYDSIHWGLRALTFNNNASSYFDYGLDQTRLKTTSHLQSTTVTLKNWTYTYDAASQLMNDGEDYYSYDELGRLRKAFVRDPLNPTAQGLQQVFTFDAFGNRTSLSSLKVTNWALGAAPPATPTTTSLVGDARNLLSYAMNTSELAEVGATNRLPSKVGGVDTGVGTPGTSGYGTTIGYDAQGNLLSVYRTPGQSNTALTLSYDALGRVSTMVDTKNATTETYLHDDEGLRIKVIDSKASKITYHVYNEARQLIASYEKVGAGSLTWKKDILYVGTKEVAEVDNANKTWVTFVDHLGSPRLIWDGTANPVKGTNLIEQKFMPFGESLANPTDTAKFAKGFTNHEQTDASGLIYAQARFYAPWFGRFLSPDPARDQHFEKTQSWNIYSYVMNQPTMQIDPTGMVAGGPGDWLKAAGSFAWNAITTHNPIYQGLAQVQDLIVSGINAKTGGNIQMTSNLGKTLEANPSTPTSTALAQGLKPVQDVMTIAVTGKVAEGVAGAIGNALAKPATTAPLTEAAAPAQIFRNGSGTMDSLTPRPVDSGGLSAWNSLDNALPGKVQVVDTSRFTNLTSILDNPATGHVSILPKDPSLMQSWIESRGGATPHPLTLELKEAVVDTVKK